MALTPVLTTAASGLQKSANQAREAAQAIVSLPTSLPRAELASPSFALSGNNAIDAQLMASGGGNLAGAFVSLIEASAAYSANAQVMRTAEHMAEATTDILT